MGIEIRNADVIIKVTEATLNKMRQRFTQAVSDEATMMVRRTRQGKDVDGSTFEPYSESYAKQRQKKGRKTSPVDLTFTGQMLAAIQTKVEETKDKVTATVFFNSTKEAEKARFNQEKRQFFGFSDEQVKRIKDKVEKG